MYLNTYKIRENSMGTTICYIVISYEQIHVCMYIYTYIRLFPVEMSTFLYLVRNSTVAPSRSRNLSFPSLNPLCELTRNF